jgi:hypothetical protein
MCSPNGRHRAGAADLPRRRLLHFQRGGHARLCDVSTARRRAVSAAPVGESLAPELRPISWHRVRRRLDFTPIVQIVRVVGRVVVRRTGRIGRSHPSTVLWSAPTRTAGTSPRPPVSRSGIGQAVGGRLTAAGPFLGCHPRYHLHHRYGFPRRRQTQSSILVHSTRLQTNH